MWGNFKYNLTNIKHSYTIYLVHSYKEKSMIGQKNKLKYIILNISWQSCILPKKFLVRSENLAWPQISSIALTLVSARTDESFVNWENVGLLFEASTRSRISDSTLSSALAFLAAMYKAEA